MMMVEVEEDAEEEEELEEGLEEKKMENVNLQR